MPSKLLLETPGITVDIVKRGKVRILWRLSDWQESSRKYGNCRVCGQHATEIFAQYGYREYLAGQWTEKDAPEMLVGHKACLLKARDNWRTHEEA
jgi:hypothetical protein